MSGAASMRKVSLHPYSTKLHFYCSRILKVHCLQGLHLKLKIYEACQQKKLKTKNYFIRQ